MFNKILVPISSEFYSKKVIERSIYLANTFQSTVHILYIIEDNPMQQMDKFSDTHLTFYNRSETHHEVLEKKQETANTILFDELAGLFKKDNIKMTYNSVHGTLKTGLKNELEKNQHDLILMGYDKQCMIDYRFIDEITIPIWIEGGGYHKSILAICSNLAPNQKVPDVSKKLSETFDWDLLMLYIIDTQDSVTVDINGQRSTKKHKQDLLFSRQSFIQQMEKKQITVKTVEGSFEQQTIKEANRIEAGLVIIGREQKQKGKFGLPVKNIKQKMAEKCKYSLLFIN